MAIATVLMGFAVAPTAGGAAVAPTIVASPSTNLVAGQTLVVKGSGFPAQQDLIGTECLRGATNWTQPECGDSRRWSVTSDGHGRFRASIDVLRTLDTVARGLVDCARAACELLFGSSVGITRGAAAPIDFDATVALPPARLSLAPSSDLLDRQKVAVHGTRFLPGPYFVLSECAVAASACGPVLDGDVVSGDVTANGRFSVRVPVYRMLASADRTSVDCAAAPGTCAIVAFNEQNADYHAFAPLAFDASVPPPPAQTLTVTPNQGLAYYSRVSVVATHFAPGDFAYLKLCASKTSSVCEDTGPSGFDSDGSLHEKPMLRRVIDPTATGDNPVDCGVVGARCVLVLSDRFGGIATAPLRFDPGAPVPPPPSVTTTPAAPYHDKELLQIEGRDFAPRGTFRVSECVRTDNGAECKVKLTGRSMTNAAGSLSSRFRVTRFGDIFGDRVDCRDSGVTCTLEVEGEGDANVSTTLVFAADE